MPESSTLTTRLPSHPTLRLVVYILTICFAAAAAASAGDGGDAGGDGDDE